MSEKTQELLRKIPSMDKLLELTWVAPLEQELGRTAVKALFADVMNEIRVAIRNESVKVLNTEHIIEEAKKRMIFRANPSLRPVVNATGVVIHTNLGRSCLAREAADAVYDVARSYNTLEYSLESGSRGHRNAHVEWLICQLTGAEAALVVNNNAGAVVLALAGLAKEREVIVSRGELVEIGGSFRIPDIMAFSGAKMVEVGTTNQTHAWDYDRAITPETAMLLKVHPSNFIIKGYHGVVDRAELSKIARENNLIFMEDMGSGMLIKTGIPTLDVEPTVAECLQSGVDIVTFSGDKVLGGPQIGCIAGSKGLIDTLRKNPFLRALRVDKMTLAAFESTIRLYIKGKAPQIPTLSMIKKSETEMKKDAQQLQKKLRDFFGKNQIPITQLQVVEVADAVGGGSFPDVTLNGWGVRVRIQGRESSSAIAERLRRCKFPIITGVQEDQLIFHVRTLLKGDIEKIVAAFSDMFLPEKGVKV